MVTPLESAFPLNSNWPAATVRSKLAEAMIAVFPTADLSGEDFSIQPYPAIAVYGPDGDLTLYAFDATDTVTADDGGITCIVVSGRRYKRSGDVVIRDAAISATTAAQPGSPSLGDTYIVPAAPSGDDWASHAKTVATFTARGWIFRQPFVGMMVYVEDEDAIYHYDSNGDWIAGLPIGAIQDGSIPPKKLTYPFAILKVEDERNAPPGSPPTAGTMYQVGTSPTGAFAGHSRSIARWTGLAWEFIAPEEGDTVYRKDDESLFSYRSGSWEPTVAKAGIQQIKRFPATDSITVPSGGANNNTPFFSAGVSIASEAGYFLRITIDYVVFNKTAGAANAVTNIGLYRDGEASPIMSIGQIPTSEAQLIFPIFSSEIGAVTSRPHQYNLLVPVSDSAPHAYRLGIVRANTDQTLTISISDCRVLIQEMVILP